MRASDAEREETVAQLSRAATEGRLALEELDARSAEAYAARTRAELMRLLEDIPQAQLTLRPDSSAQWRTPTAREHAAGEVEAFVGPLLRAHGYDLYGRGEERLVFVRKRRRWWVQALPRVVPPSMRARLRKREEVTFEFHDQGDSTVVVAAGAAPRELWAALSALER